MPFVAQRFDDGGQHEAFDISARRVMRAQLMAFDGVERAFEQCAENRRFDFAPIAAAGFDQLFELRALNGQGCATFKQAAVKAHNSARKGW